MLAALSRLTRPYRKLLSRLDEHNRRLRRVEDILKADRSDRSPAREHREQLPWYTYAATAFLTKRIGPGLSVFEYGSGNSTLWWARRVRRVVSCEHDAGWAQRLSPDLPANAQLMVQELEPDGAYCRAILQADDAFEIVVIDGRDRVNCARHTVERLTENGVIIWDNSDRPHYQPGFDFLAGRGFRAIEFAGFGPASYVPWQTSIFYRDKNCLGI
jgi:predicted O-methyltransferase YrrM